MNLQETNVSTNVHLVRWSRAVWHRWQFARMAFPARRRALWYAWCWPWRWSDDA